jgi:hypothetical protein
LVALACGDDDGGGDAASTGNAATAGDASTGGGPGGGSTDPTTMGGETMGDATATTGADSTTSGVDDATSSGSGSSGGAVSECDFEAVDSRVVIEAESLPVGEDWQILTDETGYYADGYIGWTGAAFNNDPTHGVTSVTIFIAEPGRYRLQWRNRIGIGADTTNHNDSWVKFPDATDYYGLQLQGSDERRVYPSPKCDDAAAMAAIEALPQVIAVDCVAGSSSDDWFKVYSSGANDWSWSTSTNDNNGYQVVMEFDQPGDYTFSIAARGDLHLIDRIVIHELSIDNGVVQDPKAAETACE